MESEAVAAIGALMQVVAAAAAFATPPSPMPLAAPEVLAIVGVPAPVVAARIPAVVSIVAAGIPPSGYVLAQEEGQPLPLGGPGQWAPKPLSPFLGPCLAPHHHDQPGRESFRVPSALHDGDAPEQDDLNAFMQPLQEQFEDPCLPNV